MWSPLFSSHLYQKVTFSCSLIVNVIWNIPLLGHLSYKAIFSLSQRWPLNTGLAVFVGLKNLLIPAAYQCIHVYRNLLPVYKALFHDKSIYLSIIGGDTTHLMINTSKFCYPGDNTGNWDAEGSKQCCGNLTPEAWKTPRLVERTYKSSP
jgi:hypothetical protein